MQVDQLIKDLKASKLYAQCPCGEEFAISDTFLFDGTKPFPKEALDAQTALQKALDERKADLARQIKQITERTAKTTAAVNIGKSLEKILPVAKDFKWVVPDTKVLIVFYDEDHGAFPNGAIAHGLHQLTHGVVIVGHHRPRRANFRI